MHVSLLYYYDQYLSYTILHVSRLYYYDQYYFETNASVKKCIDVLTITYVPISRKLYSGTVQIH